MSEETEGDIKALAPQTPPYLLDGILGKSSTFRYEFYDGWAVP
jgi:hypothetical protein